MCLPRDRFPGSCNIRNHSITTITDNLSPPALLPSKHPSSFPTSATSIHVIEQVFFDSATLRHPQPQVSLQIFLPLPSPTLPHILFPCLCHVNSCVFIKRGTSSILLHQDLLSCHYHCQCFPLSASHHLLPFFIPALLPLNSDAFIKDNFLDPAIVRSFLQPLSPPICSYQ